MQLLPRRILTAMAAVTLFCSTSATANDTAPLDLARYHGKVVVLDFWASWCVPCRRSFPWLNAMQAKYGDRGLVVIGVNEDTDPDDARKFLDEFPAAFTIVSDEDGQLASRFDLLAMPSSFVIDRDGEIVARHLGFRSADTAQYEQRLREALEQPANSPAATAH